MKYQQDHANWKGGKIIDKGYRYIYIPDHPRARANGYVAEHIIVLEKALQRPILPSEEPHHIDKNPGNNSPGNLMVFATKGMHSSFHSRMKAFETCGHWDWRKCSFCKQYDTPSNMRKYGNSYQHKDCRRKYQLQKYRENPEKVLSYQRQQYKANPEKVLSRQRARYAQLKKED
jgi:hypothetical protein